MNARHLIGERIETAALGAVAIGSLGLISTLVALLGYLVLLFIDRYFAAFQSLGLWGDVVLAGFTATLGLLGAGLLVLSFLPDSEDAG